MKILKSLLILFILISCTKQPTLHKVQVLSIFRNHQLKTSSDTTFSMVCLLDKDTIRLDYYKGSGLLYFKKDFSIIDSNQCRCIMGLYDYSQRFISDKERWYIQIANKSNLSQ